MAQFKVTVRPGKDVFINAHSFSSPRSCEVVFEDENFLPTQYFSDVISVIKVEQSSK
ncbi:hypothetical protein PQC38_gp048 [Aeromonas phage BUCT695]|uniref:hypothetical protein n=1 Tax=Aeromonas phage BUCT695 TaxID=2908630 RepID=UPI002329214A|nr:hypothetical protein PQC38_gp048 [Aeromonas phage BUCT695]UIW10524.1 hypothetical protein [Aeromonas phage BUCT695]